MESEPISRARSITRKEDNSTSVKLVSDTKRKRRTSIKSSKSKKRIRFIKKTIELFNVVLPPSFDPVINPSQYYPPLNEPLPLVINKPICYVPVLGQFTAFILLILNTMIPGLGTLVVGCLSEYPRMWACIGILQFLIEYIHGYKNERDFFNKLGRLSSVKTYKVSWADFIFNIGRIWSVLTSVVVINKAKGVF